MQSTIQADWCKDICPALATFNKVYNIRIGKGLVQNIVLTGSDADIRECIKKEAEFFAACSLMLNEVVCEDKTNTASPQTYFFENDEGVERMPGSLYFFKECTAKDCNRFDVTGLYDAMVFDYTGLIEALGFSDLTADMLKESAFDAKIKDTLKTMSLEQFVNNTLIAHYMNSDDDVCCVETDFAWMNDPVIAIGAPSISVTKKTETRTPKTEVKVETKVEDAVISETKIEAEPKPKHGMAGALLKGFQNNGHKIGEQENKESKKEEPKPQPVEDENVPPAPVTKEKKDQNITVKTSLTKAEDESNRKLLKELREKYEAIIEYISKTCNSQWNDIKNKMMDELKSNQFKTQWCALYMNVSNDYTTELYAKLYQLDIATNEFQKQVVHQVVTLGCAFCAQEWEEDVTFLNPGPQYIECPNCFTERGYEKRLSEDSETE